MPSPGFAPYYSSAALQYEQAAISAETADNHHAGVVAAPRQAGTVFAHALSGSSAPEGDTLSFLTRLETLLSERHVQLRMNLDDWMQKDKAVMSYLVKEHYFQEGHSEYKQHSRQAAAGLSAPYGHITQHDVKQGYEIPASVHPNASSRQIGEMNDSLQENIAPEAPHVVVPELPKWIWEEPSEGNRGLGGKPRESDRSVKSSEFSSSESVKTTLSKRSQAPGKSIKYAKTDEDLKKAEAARSRASHIARGARNSRNTAAQEVAIQAQKVVGSKGFELFFAVIILLNSVQTGIQLEYMSTVRERSGDEEPFVFFALQNGFSFLFLVELLLRLCSDGKLFFFNAWNYLDMFVVFASLLEFILYFLREGDAGGDGLKAVGNVRIMRILRITRLARILRMVKIVRFIYALRTFITSILSTLRSLFWAMLLLMMIIYLFGMVFAQLCEDLFLQDGDASVELEKLDMYFGSLSKSVFTLFKTVSGGVSWEEATYALSEVNSLAVSIFLAYFVFTYFAVLNVITGVFCQSAIESAQRDYDLVVQANLANKDMYEHKLRQLFNDIDGDRSGEVDIREFESHLAEPSVQAYLTSLELNSSDIWRLFKLLDQNDSAVIDLDEFLEGCFKLRGPAKAIEMAEVMYDLRHLRKRLGGFVDTISQALFLLLEEAGLDSDFLTDVDPIPNSEQRISQQGSFTQSAELLDTITRKSMARKSKRSSESAGGTESVGMNKTSRQGARSSVGALSGLHTLASIPESLQQHREE